MRRKGVAFPFIRKTLGLPSKHLRKNCFHDLSIVFFGIRARSPAAGDQGCHISGAVISMHYWTQTALVVPAAGGSRIMIYDVLDGLLMVCRAKAKSIDQHGRFKRDHTSSILH